MKFDTTSMPQWDRYFVGSDRVLKKLAESPHQVFNRSQLEDTLYGWSDGVESNTIDVHIHNLRKKISPNIVKTLRGVGYRIGDIEES